MNLNLVVQPCFFFQAEDGIRGLVRSRGLGDVYKRQGWEWAQHRVVQNPVHFGTALEPQPCERAGAHFQRCLLYTSDAADDLLCVDLGGRRIIIKKNRTPAYLGLKGD